MPGQISDVYALVSEFLRNVFTKEEQALTYMGVMYRVCGLRLGPNFRVRSFSLIITSMNLLGAPIRILHLSIIFVGCSDIFYESFLLSAFFISNTFNTFIFINMQITTKQHRLRWFFLLRRFRKLHFPTVLFVIVFVSVLY